MTALRHLTAFDMREGTKDAVLQAVVLVYGSFLSSQEYLFQSRFGGSKKFYKYTPENIEHMITELLNGRPLDLRAV